MSLESKSKPVDCTFENKYDEYTHAIQFGKVLMQAI